MRIEMDAQGVEALRARLDALEDAQATGADEYVVDLYEFDPPLSMEVSLADGVCVLAAEQMAYSDELDGWYICAPVSDVAVITRAILSIA